MQKTQEERIKELLDKYAAFIHQTDAEKVKVVRLCGILSYLEALQQQNITVDTAVKNLTEFLDKTVIKYTGGDSNG
jgi:hypothetical protein